MKVLWFSNCSLSGSISSGSGSWLYAMRDLIVDDVELVNITDEGVDTITPRIGNGIKEYILPKWKLVKGIPSVENINKINDIICQVNPDIIHIWGIEKYWALLFCRGFIKFDKVLLEMQGVAAGVYDVYYGGLTPKDFKSLKSFKTLLMPNQNHQHMYEKMRRSALFEEEILPHFRFIATQSDWTRDQLLFICNDNTCFYHSLRPIRKEFYISRKWVKPVNLHPIIYTSFSYYVPFKGAHVLFKALALLKKHIPDVVLRIAGPDIYGLPFYRGLDYSKFLTHLIDKYGLKENIYFCGNLNAQQIVTEILQADVVVNPSFVESYSAVAAESLYLGAPTVLSYAGAMVNFSKDKPVALYYSPMDYRSLAARIYNMIYDTETRDLLTRNAIEVMFNKCAPEKVKERQIETYKSLFS